MKINNKCFDSFQMSCMNCDMVPVSLHFHCKAQKSKAKQTANLNDFLRLLTI